MGKGKKKTSEEAWEPKGRGLDLRRLQQVQGEVNIIYQTKSSWKLLQKSGSFGTTDAESN